MKIEKYILLNNVDKVEKFINDIAIINSRVDTKIATQAHSFRCGLVAKHINP